jgi:hypothetical protein
MKTPLQVLESIHVADPCPVSWELMNGSGRVRHCSHCNQNVYDLSSLTAEQAAKFVQEASGSVCIRFYRRADGTVITEDCSPLRALRRLRRKIYKVGVAAASLLGFACAISGCGNESNRPLSTTGALMGKIACPSPTKDEPAPVQPLEPERN